MTDPAPRRRHYAFALRKAKGGWRVESPMIEFPSRGEADKFSLKLLADHEDTGSITLVDRELRPGDVLTAAELKRGK